MQMVIYSYLCLNTREYVMSEQASATIIAFPRPKAPAASGAAADGPERLRIALLALDAALAEQRAAVTAWREGLAALRGSVQGLGQSLGRYQSRLGALAEDVGGLHREARRLEDWADAAIARDSDTGQALR